MKKMVLMLIGLSLSGCQSYMERMEMADDQACRKIITDRNDHAPDAYTQCRANFQQYRQQMAVRSISIDTSSPAGPPHHWSLD